MHFREDQSLVELANGPYRQALIIFNSPSFFTHAFTTFFAGLFWLTAAVINPEDGPLFRRLSRLDETRYLAVRILPVSAIMLYAAAFPISDVVPPVRGMELLRCALGVGLGLLTFEAYALLSRLVASKFGFKRGHVLLVLLVCLIFLLHFFPKLLTVVSLFKLLAGITAFYILVTLAVPRWRYWIFVLCVFLPLLIGGLDRYKYSFPQMEAMYACPVKLKERLAGAAEVPAGYECNDKSIPAAPRRLTPAEALARFSDEQKHQGVSLKGHRLIVVATSGGAYRATFWTALVLDRLRDMSRKNAAAAGLANSIRLITGASGGMVGGAYYATLDANELASADSNDRLVALIETDIKQRQIAQDSMRSWQYDLPLPRDSLSDVAQQLSNWDSLYLFAPRSVFGLGPISDDRGRTLQTHWRRLGLSHGKTVTFETLGASVAAGGGASLILSPMIVETGQPLLISDLDLSGIADASGHDTMDFFAAFPGSWHDFTVQTAVRMSATFPYVAPAVPLPTQPPRRVVDAGYFDNYGMTAALSYLRQASVRQWMKDNKLTGAIIVQLNAFPVLSDKSVNADATKQPYDDCAESAPYEGADPFGWLLSPFEGLTSARERSMLFRSELALGALKEIYAKDDLKLTRVAFENAARSSLSWYLPKANLDCMRTELENAQNAQAFESVARAWSGAGGDFDWPIR